MPSLKYVFLLVVSGFIPLHASEQAQAAQPARGMKRTQSGANLDQYESGKRQAVGQQKYEKESGDLGHVSFSSLGAGTSSSSSSSAYVNPTTQKLRGTGASADTSANAKALVDISSASCAAPFAMPSPKKSLLQELNGLKMFYVDNDLKEIKEKGEEFFEKARSEAKDGTERELVYFAAMKAIVSQNQSIESVIKGAFLLSRLYKMIQEDTEADFEWLRTQTIVQHAEIVRNYKKFNDSEKDRRYQTFGKLVNLYYESFDQKK